MIVGIDFDNTLALYDHLFHRLASERGLINPGIASSKRAVRSAVRALEDGERHWRELQGAAYGPCMLEARPAPGALEALRQLMRQGGIIHVVSHKTQYSPHDSTRTNLRDVATQWLESRGFLRFIRHVHFADTRAAKIERIRELGCTAFVDDLEEVLRDPGFPAGVARLLYDPVGEGGVEHVERFTHWTPLAARLVVELQT